MPSKDPGALLNSLISKFAGIISLAVLLAILVAGLWPFNFFSKNQVDWLPDRDGVRFHGQGIVTGPVIDQKQWQRLFRERAITIEIRLRPELETAGAPCILTLFDGKAPDLFTLRQWRSHLVVWSRPDDPADRKKGMTFQEIGYRDVLPKGQDVFIAIASDRSGTAIYVNGGPAKAYPRRSLLAAAPSGDTRLILGNSPSGEGHWTGEITGLAVYNRALPPEEAARDYKAWVRNDSFAIRHQAGLVALYPFYERQGETIRNVANPDETLNMPDLFKPVQRRMIEWPGPEFRWNLPSLQDVAVNVLGFIPAGFFFAALLLNAIPKRRLAVCLAAVLLGTGLSLLIELTQAWLPTRDSSLIDVACNAAGTILGILIYQIWTRKNKTVQKEEGRIN